MSEDTAILSLRLEAPDEKPNVSDILWKAREEGLIRLGDMEDKHIRSAALMLMGMGYQEYNAPDHVKIAWLTVLKAEWIKRVKERNCTWQGTSWLNPLR